MGLVSALLAELRRRATAGAVSPASVDSLVSPSLLVVRTAPVASAVGTMLMVSWLIACQFWPLFDATVCGLHRS